MSNVSMVDGHIDRNQVTPQEAIEFFKNEIVMLKYAPEINGCEMTEEWKRQLEIYKLAISALEERIPKKRL
jgi:hypothetical protein